MTKKEWREKVSRLKKEMTEEAWREKSQKIHSLFFLTDEWKNAQHIALYYSIEQEVDTLSVIRQGWKEGKNMYLPSCQPKRHELIFCRIHDFSELTEQYFGIPEPRPDNYIQLVVDELQTIIVPGVVFDMEGYRIGYGGGYYDRFLPKLKPAVRRVSLAFDYQVSTGLSLPREDHDVPVHKLITNEGTYEVDNRR
ncbi:5-formyltetrahydrofolate cyclo-ligase [Caldalkalibacillus mannanilyticus]|uniref:5-formyltetrahydrofolate cyclo-ligase n=1 Tax=Caldalkalibacillus mannanilyticus TaxID=1418 RepID=UPI00046A49C1|nr:5-formyltetrahydrofolate cyclo-ligase [Caldalkalibacillus mannanilyticus]